MEVAVRRIIKGILRESSEVLHTREGVVLLDSPVSTLSDTERKVE